MFNVATEVVPNPFQYDAGCTLNGTIYRYGVRFYDAKQRQLEPNPTPSPAKPATPGPSLSGRRGLSDDVCK